MKFLLTSQMIHNQSIANALAELLDKPFAEATVAYVITSHNAARGEKSWFVQNLNSIHDLGWKDFYMIDVAGMDGLLTERWMKQIEESDVIVMGGGANYFLSYWLEKSGLIAKLPELLQTRVYVGSSAGSMLMQHQLCTGSEATKEFAKGNWGVDLAILGPEGRSSSTSLGLIDVLIRPHYGSAKRDIIAEELFQGIATRFNMPLYALDDDSALKVVNGEISVVSEGEWKLIHPQGV